MAVRTSGDPASVTKIHRGGSFVNGTGSAPRSSQDDGSARGRNALPATASRRFFFQFFAGSCSAAGGNWNLRRDVLRCRPNARTKSGPCAWRWGAGQRSKSCDWCFRKGLLLALVGLGSGARRIFTSWARAHAVRAFMKIKGSDPLAVGSVSVVLLVAALLACLCAGPKGHSGRSPWWHSATNRKNTARPYSPPCV